MDIGRAERDPAADLKGALPPAPKTHVAAVTDPLPPSLAGLDLLTAYGTLFRYKDIPVDEETGPQGSPCHGAGTADIR